MVAENLEIVRKRIQNACRRCNRRPEDIILVGVTKTFGPETVQQAIAAGLFDVGENYVQELNDKRNQVPDEAVRWHFIGHLQSNKVKYLAGFIHLIHSVDNDSVAGEIHKRGEKAGRTIDVLIEVHTTDEATKFGVRPDKTLELIKRISQFGHLRVRGLMTMGPFSDDPNDSRPSFQQLAALQKDIAKIHDRFSIPTLMVSHDPTEIARLSDMVYRLDNGRITGSGRPAEVLAVDNIVKE